LGETEAVDWSVAWRDRIVAHTVGRLTVTPPWLAESFDSAQTVVIEPGMAFGTGDHETTRGALRLLQQEVRPGFVVADLGAGSAVLAIAAAKLGASRVFAVEYDADALPNAECNVLANDVATVVHCFEGDAFVLLPLLAPLDLIVANILSSVLAELLPAMRRALRPGGRAILAGILCEEERVLREALAAGGWRVIAADVEGEWWSVTVEASPAAQATRRR
jgi:ribosomal protein L11 methyltransferase